MKAAKTKPRDIEEYIARFPSNVRGALRKLRSTIRKAAPRAQEKISYAIPTFTQSGNLVHFAAHEKHIGFYPGSSGIANFKRELAGYESSKGSVQFPLGRPIPYGLVSRIVKFRVRENSGETRKPRKKK